MDHSSNTKARYITAFAAFLAFMGIGVVDPILPSIAEQIGASHWQVEMLFTSYIVIMAVMMVPSGILAARLGDKKMMVIGLGVVAVFSFLCGQASGIGQLAGFRAGWGLGNSMFIATVMTLLIALTPDVTRAVGLYEGAIGLGMAAGPLVGGLLGSYTWRLPFYGTCVLIVLAFLLVLVWVKQPPRTGKKVAGGREFLKIMQYAPFLRPGFAAMMYYYGFFVILAYSPLVLQLSPIQLGQIFCLWGIMLGYGSISLAHKLEERYPAQKLLFFGLLAFSILTALLFFAEARWLQIVLIGLCGLASGVNNSVFTSHVIEVSPYERSVTSGAYNFLRWIGGAVAPVLSGVLGHALSSKAPFAVSSVIVLVGVLLIAVKAKVPAPSK